MKQLKHWVVAALMIWSVSTFAAVTVWTEPVSGASFVRIPAGCFQMGLPEGAFADTFILFRNRVRDAMPQHEVCLDEYWIMQTEVTRSMWQKVDASEAAEDSEPVSGIAWRAAVSFADRLSTLTGERFRLPTEAEWEYACRGKEPPVTKEFQSRQKLDTIAWYSSSYGAATTGVRVQQLQPVGGKQPNTQGLYDMLGNAWEWVLDTYDVQGYRQHGLYNPVFMKIGQDAIRRVIRGGGIRSEGSMLRCEIRAWLPEGEPVDTVGFRLVREIRK